MKTRISTAAIAFLASLALAVVAGGFYVSARTTAGEATISADSDALRETTAKLDIARATAANVVAALEDAAITSTLPRQNPQDRTPDATAGEPTLSSLLALNGNAGFALTDLPNATRSLAGQVDTLASVGAALEQHRELLRDLPISWPIINALGRVTMEFGPNIHPIAKIWYMHKGIDIAYLAGTPVVATGDGIVTDAGVDTASGYGGYVEISHAYGFSTKYTHLGVVKASRGEAVAQGQTIGLLGSTGISTGPHVHYEIAIGSEVVDPAPLLRIANPDFQRRVLTRF